MVHQFNFEQSSSQCFEIFKFFISFIPTHAHFYTL